MEANNVLFRCSGLAHIMADGNAITEKQLLQIAELEEKAVGPKGLTAKQAEELERLINKRDNPELSEGVKTHLIDVFASHKYGRREEIKNKFLDKGNDREEDSITMVSRHTGIYFLKNNIRLRNNFIQGEPDLFVGKDIEHATDIIDTKTSWSLHTFLRTKYKKLDLDYYWQGQGYMDLTRAKTHTVAFCLVNGTADLIIAEKRSLAFKMKIQDESDENFKKGCRQIEINHIFDIAAFKNEYPGFPFDNDVNNWSWDIPKEDRIFTITFDRNDEDIRKMHDRVLQCREWMEINLFEKASTFTNVAV